jgi:flagellar hook-basal body complex protein FliE
LNNSIETPLLNTSMRGAYNISTRLSGHNIRPDEIEKNSSSFETLVKEASQDAVSTIRNADVAMQAGMKEEISIQQVVQATMAAESTLQTVVGLRDKMVSAYQEILRMPI